VKYYAKLDGEEREFWFERRQSRLFAHSGGKTFEVDVSLVGDGGVFSLLVDGRSYDVVADVERERVTLQMLGERFVVGVEDQRERAAHSVAGNKPTGRHELRAAMPGVVVAVQVEVGTEVEEGQALIVLEAMKMQNPLCAEGAGKVTRILVRPGEAVAAGALLAVLE
jgi:biotin carboxyl carrier protein